MSFEDDSVSVVPNPATISSGRAVTPSSILKSSNTKRYSTPNKSLPRSSSAPKSRTRLAKAIEDAQIALKNRAPSAGRRKQRQWENDHLFGVHRYARGKDDVLCDEIDHMMTESSYLHNLGLQLEWKSNFSELLLAQNATILKNFLNCTTSESTITSAIHMKTKESRLPQIDESCEEKYYQSSWNRIEPRLQSILIRIISNATYQTFLEDMEKVLKHFMDSDNPLPMDLMTKNITSVCTSPIACSQQQSDNVLLLPLHDSSMHRLLVHALAQFHGLTSKSVTRKKQRVTTISKKRRMGNQRRFDIFISIAVSKRRANQINMTHTSVVTNPVEAHVTSGQIEEQLEQLTSGSDADDWVRV